MTVGDLTLHTIERPWENNETDASCVPAGEYLLIPYLSPKHGQTWRLHNPDLNVWGLNVAPPRPMRTNVEIHSMNFARESEGCIGAGLSGLPMLDPITSQVEPAIQDSRAAIDKLRALLDGSTEEDTLTIIRDGLYGGLQG